MSFVDDVDSLKTKLHLRDMPTSLRIGLVLLGAIILFILFQGLWQLASGDTHLIDGSAQSSWQEGSEEGLTVTQAEAAQEGTEASTSQPARLSVHVVGEVANPGLYEVDAGSRVQAAIDAAGGFTNDANQGSVNLAREIVDGEQIVVASKSASAAGAAGAGSAGSAATASSGASGAGSSSAPGGLVNINTEVRSYKRFDHGIAHASNPRTKAPAPIDAPCYSCPLRARCCFCGGRVRGRMALWSYSS